MKKFNLRIFILVFPVLITNCLFYIKTKDELLRKYPNANIFVDKDKFKVTYECSDWVVSSFDPYGLTRVNTPYSPLCDDNSSYIEVIGKSDGSYIGYTSKSGYLLASEDSILKKIAGDSIIASSECKSIGNFKGFVGSVGGFSPPPYEDYIGDCFRLKTDVGLFQKISDFEGLFYDRIKRNSIIHLHFKIPFLLHHGDNVRILILKVKEPFAYETRMGENIIPSYDVLLQDYVK